MLKRVLHILLLVVAGVAATILLEIGVVMLLNYAPPSIDLSGGFYWGVGFVLIVMLGLFRWLFFGLWRRGPPWYPVVFAGSFFLSHHALLARRALVDSLSNPTPTQTAYNLLIGLACLLLLAWVWWGRRQQ